MRRLILLSLLFLAACVGTKEQVLPLLLVTAGDEGLSFYLADALREGEDAPLGRWEGIDAVDVFADEETLWVLTPSALYGYDAALFSAEAVPNEAEAKKISLALDDCAEGYLKAGAYDLLVVCANDRVYRVKGGELLHEDVAELAALPAVAYALYPDPEAGEDLLAAAYAGAEGFSLVVGEEELDAPRPALVEALDLYLPPGGETLYLLAVAGGGENSLVYTYTGELKEVAGAKESEPRRLAGEPSAVVAYGQGVLLVKEKAEFATYYDYAAAYVDKNLYLYLAGDRALLVYDLAASPPYRVRYLAVGGVRSVTGLLLR